MPSRQSPALVPAMPMSWTTTSVSHLFTPEEQDILTTLVETRPRSAYQRYMDRQQAQADALRVEIRHLEEPLHTLQAAQQIQDPAPCEYSQLARNERRRMLSAIFENRRLRAAVQEQADFATSLSKLLHRELPTPFAR
ncbi:hypothetical protein SPRG_11619 [Saprolegnia parasitica CBS 223.65]|uniref:Uncharacterized protein n=1 Tax=Saprolegnia parasitica (strain CBS 223.65) TaxID=695850 RepID=A0A067C2E2_SAPPC|nr:hypothetical protein SPRG_11619 [Saprolegnia parasitica CBS 223.65]KDO23305.1 hypothetical protein SPRG_11619 [Saprolegnia parasitica CBS 223.65]|eukprot:XP_012205957.1 hypothetical protein SPRG_11619 [Saprolegnia parasitica CBS 223.65]